MRRLAIIFASAALSLLALTPVARGAFGPDEFDVAFTGAPPAGSLPGVLGPTISQAGSHPYQMVTSLHFPAIPNGKGGETLEEAVKDIDVAQMPGFVGNPSAVPTCSSAEFLTRYEGLPEPVPACPPSSALGIVAVKLASKIGSGPFSYGAAYNLEPPPGVAAKIGFWIQSVPVSIELGVNEAPPFNIVGGPTNITQVLEVIASKFILWGNPSDPSHDSLRGICLGPSTGQEVIEPVSKKSVFNGCKAGVPQVPFLTLPRSCEGPLKTTYRTDSWQNPGARLENGEPDLSDPAWVTGSTETHESAGNPMGMSGCGKLDFSPEISIQPTTTSAESASGLDLEINVPNNEGLGNPDGDSQADIKATEFALPVGVTVNPSAAEGLGVCTKAQFQAASLRAAGCPQASKLGSLEIDTPILKDHTLHGNFYQAAQGDNPFGSLLAAYLVIRDPELGIFVKLPAEIKTNEQTGQIITRVDNMPPFPLEKVKVHLRAGARAPLVSPPTCGPHTTTALLYPSSGAPPLKAQSTFTTTSGPGGGPCPPGGTPPFAPGFEAGATNNAASYFSPFNMRLTRADGEQDLTRFSAILPPGVVPKLAGIAKCPDAAIAAAENDSRSGRQELASPSCPASSQVGHVLAGAGVGSALTYVPGSLYLAGPYKGDPLSVVAIVPAVAGPFDVGTIVTRVALNLNPVTYRGEVDGSKSDPIPHILKGIPVKVRDIRVYADRPEFTLNSTSCDPSATAAQIFGSGADVFNPADDVALGRESRYQASSCASLGFKPKLTLQMKGGIKRDKNPALSSTITYPYPSGPGYANIGKAIVTLPPSEFIDPDHINNPCTRVQFNANECPASSILGTAKAISPLLDDPLEGQVIFRSNGGERKLPDVVVALHGLVDITLVGAVDTATPKTSPRIRTTFSSVPDAPVSSFTLNLYGGKKGLLVNNRNLCKHKLKAKVALTGQNGTPYNTEPVVKVASCGGKAGKSSKRG